MFNTSASATLHASQYVTFELQGPPRVANTSLYPSRPADRPDDGSQTHQKVVFQLYFANCAPGFRELPEGTCSACPSSAYCPGHNDILHKYMNCPLNHLHMQVGHACGPCLDIGPQANPRYLCCVQIPLHAWEQPKNTFRTH